MAKCVLFTIGFIALLSAGCSNSWREGDSGHSPEEISSMLEEVNSAVGATGSTATGGTGSTADSTVADVLQLRDGAVIYFADAPGALGPVGSLLSFVDLSFLGIGDAEPLSFKGVRVFFLDNAPKFGLIVGIDQSGTGSYQYVGFMSQEGSVEAGDFQAKMTGSTGEITIESDDVDSDVLNDVIQLHVFDSNGYVGKFSTLVGYAQ